MIIFALLAFVWSLFQILIVTSPSRSVSWKYVLATFAAGTSAAFVATLIAEQGIAALLASDAHSPLRAAVRSAAYRQDPLIEEACKLLPLLGLMLMARVRRSLGFTDIVILSASLGAGFGFMECALSVGSVLSTARWVDHFFLLSGGGFGMMQMAIPDPLATVSSWLPHGYAALGPMEDPKTALNSHIVYGVFAGTGLAVLTKAPKRWWIWIPAFGYAVLDHIGFNADAASVELPFSTSPVLAALRSFDGLLVIFALIGVIVIDRLRHRRAMRSEHSLKLALGSAPPLEGAGLILANIRSVPALFTLWRFVLERRAHLIASRTAGRDEADNERRARLEVFAGHLRGSERVVSTSSAPSAEQVMQPHQGGLVRRLLILGTLCLSLPPVLYCALIGILDPAWMAGLFGNRVVFDALIGLMMAGMVMQALTGLRHARALSDAKGHGDGRTKLWHGFGVQSALGGLALSVFTLSVALGKDALRPIGSTHAIEHWLAAHPLAATILAVAVAALTALVPLAVGILFPEVSFGIGVVQAITGKDLLTGQQLSFLERTLGLIPGVKSSKLLEEKGITRAREATDFIAGRLGGQLYDPVKLRRLGDYLERRGITLQVGDEFLPMGKAGGFDAHSGRLALRSSPTEYEVWHELNHYGQYKKLGEGNYSAQTRAAKEQYVFDALENSSKRWNALTIEQRNHAIDYIHEVGGIR